MLYLLSAIVGLVAIVSPTFAQESSPIIGPRARPPDGARYSAVQKGLDLTHPQRRWLYANIAHSGVVAPTGFQPKLGMIVPSEIELQPLPPTVIKKMPALKHYQYAKVDLKVLLVDERRALVEIVENPLL